MALTRIQKIMDTEGLSVYRLLMLMDKKPSMDTSNWQEKLSGRRNTSVDDVALVASAISEWSKKRYEVSDLGMEISMLIFQ